MNKIASGLAKIVLLSAMGVAGCTYEDYYQSQDYQQPAQQQFKQQVRHEIENPCGNPKVFTRENDSRFSVLEDKNFLISGYNERENCADYNDVRWIFSRGESFVVTVAFPREIYGSTAMLLVNSPNKQVLGKKFIPVSENNDFFVTRFDVSDILNNYKLTGDYTFSWAFNSGGMNPDFKLACIQYVRIRE